MSQGQSGRLALLKVKADRLEEESHTILNVLESRVGVAVTTRPKQRGLSDLDKASIRDARLDAVRGIGLAPEGAELVLQAVESLMDAMGADDLDSILSRYEGLVESYEKTLRSVETINDDLKKRFG